MQAATGAVSSSGGADRRPTDRPGTLPAAVLFDWDGTLVDSLAAIYRANTRALATLGIRMDRTWFRERYTPDWRRSYTELGVPEHLFDELAERWALEMQDVRPRALPWARGGLRRLRRHGVRLGIVTASMRAVVEPAIPRLGLEGVFEVAVYSDDVARTKPWPDALLLALDHLGLAPGEALYVGDTPTDLAMATAAGTPFVAVGRTTDAEAFAAHGVDQLWPGVGAWVDGLLDGSAGPSDPSPRR
jgi:HAD superfamily hydrolase (TIGR01509 family)